MSQQQSHPYSNGSQTAVQPNPEVGVKAKRRTFTATYKLRILEEADQQSQFGQVGALLRREGLYSSHLATWRKQRSAGQLQGLTPRKRGRKKDEQTIEMNALRRENEKLRNQLAQADLIITAQKKLAQALKQVVTQNKGEK
jgi:transposase